MYAEDLAIHDRRVRAMIDFSIALLVVTGTFGYFWITDDYDDLKLIMGAYAGLPLAFGYLALRLFQPDWGIRFPRLFLGTVSAIVATFILGNVLVLNALTAEQNVVKRDVEFNKRIVTVDARRGGLGIVFRTRW